MLGTFAHHRFLRSKFDAKCFTAETDPLVDRYVTPVLNEKSDLSGSDNVVDTSRIVV